MRPLPPHLATLAILTLWTAVALAEAPATQPDETVAVKRGDLSLTVTADGWFEPLDAVEVRLRPKAYAGELKIEAVAAHGSAVKQGDPLLKINTDEINRQLASAQNELGLASANLAKAQADMRLGAESDEFAMTQQQESLASAQRLLEWWQKVDGPQYLKSQELEVKQVKDIVEDQQDELDQLRKMYKSEELTNATSDIVVKRAVRSLKTWQTRLGLAENRSERNRATEYEDNRRRVEAALQQQKQALAALEASQAQTKAARESSLFAANAAYEAAKRKSEELRSDLALMAITAPFDGKLLYGKLSSGTWERGSPDSLRSGDKVTADQVLATFYAPDQIRVVAAVPETHISRVGGGDVATVTPRARPEQPLTGKCQVPSPSATIQGDPAKFEVRIAVDPPQGALAPGFRAAVEIDVEDAKGVLLLPVSAVGDGKVRAAGEKGQTKRVVTGRSDGDMVEIVSGIAEGERVAAKFKKEQ